MASSSSAVKVVLFRAAMLAWILRDGKVTSGLIGAAKPQQILDNIAALNNTTFTADEMCIRDSGNKFLGHIRECDAIVHVVRCFDDDNIIHVVEEVTKAEAVDQMCIRDRLRSRLRPMARPYSLERPSSLMTEFTFTALRMMSMGSFIGSSSLVQ